MFTVQGQGRSLPSIFLPVSVSEIALSTEIGTPVRREASSATRSQVAETVVADSDAAKGATLKTMQSMEIIDKSQNFGMGFTL
ncbi:hypothetical protein [Rhodobacter sp. JA431]|uniref:hypothetical protein n=1 Tax=Rhodobacter sp. JA431 TaxID=570013 RepID=UPI002016746A|nr:hypothetical protein [Rhodobacter sp. JA431]